MNERQWRVEEYRWGDRFGYKNETDPTPLENTKLNSAVHISGAIIYLDYGIKGTLVFDYSSDRFSLKISIGNMRNENIGVFTLGPICHIHGLSFTSEYAAPTKIPRLRQEDQPILINQLVSFFHELHLLRQESTPLPLISKEQIQADKIPVEELIFSDSFARLHNLKQKKYIMGEIFND